MKLPITAALLLSAASHAGAAERAIDKEVLVPAGVDAVWQAWTTSEGITSFFAPEAVIEPRVGGAFHIHFDPKGAAGSKGRSATSCCRGWPCSQQSGGAASGAWRLTRDRRGTSRNDAAVVAPMAGRDLARDRTLPRGA